MDKKFKSQVEKDLAVGFYDSGVVRADRGEWVQAIADFTKVIQLNSSVMEAYINRALAHSKVGNLTGALADLNVVVRLNPNDSVVFHNRAVIRYYLADRDGALADLAQVRRLRGKVNPEFENILSQSMNNVPKYDLDEEFTTFVKTKYPNAELVADALQGRTNIKNADFFFKNRSFLMELKTLEKDAFEDIYKIIEELSKKEEIQIPSTGIKISKILENHPDRDRLNKILYTKMTASLEGAFEKANRQIRETKKCFNLNTSIGVALVVNLDNTGLVPLVARDCLHRLFLKEKPEGGYRYEEISIIIYISQVHFQPQPDNQDLMPMIVMLRKDEASEIEKAFLNEFTEQWSSFSGIPIIDKGDQNSGDMLSSGPFFPKQKSFKHISQTTMKKG